jgi:hypothetical protein
MAEAFNHNRNERGGSCYDFVDAPEVNKEREGAGNCNAVEENAKIVEFIGTGMSKWITSSLTTLWSTFLGATKMNADLSGWDVSKVCRHYI